MDGAAGCCSDFAMQALEDHAKTVYGLCLVSLKKQADAQKAFQKVFLRLEQKKYPCDSKENAKALVTSVCADYCKKWHVFMCLKKSRFFEGDQCPALEPQDKLLLGKLIALSKKHRAAVYLFFCEGYDAQETAKILGVKESKVNKWIEKSNNIIRELEGGNTYEQQV